MRRRAFKWQTMVRILCVLALFAVGLSHRVPAVSAASLSEAEIALLTLPDGTLPELCLPDHEADGKAPHMAGMAGCEACLISSSILVPTPADVRGRAMAVVRAIVAPLRVEAFQRQIFPPNAAPRAPPRPALV